MIRFPAMLVLLLITASCQRSSSPLVGGTPGTLRLGDAPLADFHVRVFRESDRALHASGATNGEGRFQLVMAGKEKPCWLEPGSYIFTLESFGTEAPKLQPTLKDQNKSPLKLQWTGQETEIDLVVPSK